MIQKNQLVIFDWDDTLLCSSYLHCQGYHLESVRPFPQILTAYLHQIDELALQLLRKTLEKIGKEKTFIVTNAESGWVQISAQLFLPQTHDFISDNDVNIISARSLYDQQFPGNPTTWKFRTFVAVVASSFGIPLDISNFFIDVGGNLQYKSIENVENERKMDEMEIEEPLEPTIDGKLCGHVSNKLLGFQKSNKIPKFKIHSESDKILKETKYICSLGDSQSERLSCKYVSMCIENTVTKSIKLIERPSIEELIMQLTSINDNITNIINMEESLDFMMVVSKEFD